MIFCSQRALRQLLKSGIVATMRDYPYQRGRRVILKNCEGKILGRGVVLEVRTVSEESLRALVNHSGFKSTEEWISEARKLHRKMPRFIVLVKMI